MGTIKTVTVCVNRRLGPDRPSCAARGGLEIAAALRALVMQRGLAISVETFHCLGHCERGPNLKLSPGGECVHGVRREDLPRLLDRLAADARE